MRSLLLIFTLAATAHAIQFPSPVPYVEYERRLWEGYLADPQLEPKIPKILKAAVILHNQNCVKTSKDCYIDPDLVRLSPVPYTRRIEGAFSFFGHSGKPRFEISADVFLRPRHEILPTIFALLCHSNGELDCPKVSDPGPVTERWNSYHENVVKRVARAEVQDPTKIALRRLSVLDGRDTIDYGCGLVDNAGQAKRIFADTIPECVKFDAREWLYTHEALINQRAREISESAQNGLQGKDRWNRVRESFDSRLAVIGTGLFTLTEILLSAWGPGRALTLIASLLVSTAGTVGADLVLPDDEAVKDGWQKRDFWIALQTILQKYRNHPEEREALAEELRGLILSTNAEAAEGEKEVSSAR